MKETLTVNQPLANTYRWLRSNGTEIEPFQAKGSLAIAWEQDEFVRESAVSMEDLKTGMGLELKRLTGGAVPFSHSFTAEPCADTVLRLRLGLNRDAGPQHSALRLRAETGCRMTVVADVSAAGGGAGLAALQTKALIDEGAVLRLVLIQRLGAEDTFLNDLGVRCAEGGRFEYVRLILGGHKTIDGCSAALAGDRSAFTAEIGYRLGGEDLLDMNYEAVHTGKRTECAIRASGVLRDRADKLFRGTIDFRKGCAGSVGNETEDVLLMDDTVRCRTVPVILCGEEDVEGNHGATIGRLDENLIYYLESRGMAREAIDEMCAQARIDAVVRKIPDPETIRKLFPWLAEDEEAAL